MKNSTIFLTLSVLFFSACKSGVDNMVTKVFPDGSCYREFSGVVDSAFMVGHTEKTPFPMVLDSSWKISWTYSPLGRERTYSAKWPLKQWKWEKDTSKHLILEVRARRSYASVDEMNKTFRYNACEWRHIVPRAEFEKKFKWFFTVYTFKEVYPKYNPLKLVSIDKYLSKEDIQLYFRENPYFHPELTGMEIKDQLEAIDKKTNEWLKASMFEEQYQIVKNNLKDINSENFDSIHFSSVKDSLRKMFMEREALEGDILKVIETYYKGKVSFKSKMVKEKIENFSDSVFSPFRKHLTYQLLMPGKVIETNSHQLYGDTLRWKLNTERFFFTSYEIYARSRTVNIWAFIVSGVFVLGVVLSFRIRKRKYKA